MTPRQIQETFRIIGHTVAGDAENKGTLLWCFGVGVILMSALKVSNPDMYHRIGMGNQLALDSGSGIVNRRRCLADKIGGGFFAIAIFVPLLFSLVFAQTEWKRQMLNV
jgi:hypothetical protein